MMLWTLIPVADTEQITWEVEGELYILAPDGFLGTAESIISGKIRLGSIHPQYW